MIRRARGQSGGYFRFDSGDASDRRRPKSAADRSEDGIRETTSKGEREEGKQAYPDRRDYYNLNKYVLKRSPYYVRHCKCR